jgi:hypothetical protein
LGNALESEMKKLSERELLDQIGDLWEERMDHARRGLILSALLFGVMLVCWWMAEATNGTTAWHWLVVWAIVQAGIAADALVRMARVDDRAEELVERSTFWEPIAREFRKRR